MQDRINRIIREVAEELNATLKNKIPLELGGAAPLYGQGGGLDSIALVSLIVAVEQAVEDEFEVELVLANEKAMSQKNSPFRSIGTLGEHVRLCLDEAAEG